MCEEFGVVGLVIPQVRTFTSLEWTGFRIIILIITFCERTVHCSFGGNVHEHYNATGISYPCKIWKQCTFHLEINISIVLALRMSSGKSFHAIPRARYPYVKSLVLDSFKQRVLTLP